MKKIDVSKNHQVEIEVIFEALAHASRRHILLLLSKNGPMLGGAIAAELNCSWPTTTVHLQVLKNAGLANLEKRGREKIYSLNLVRLKLIEKWIYHLKPKRS